MKFTFKNNPAPKGLSRILHKKGCKIKLKGVWIGSINQNNIGKYEVRFMVVKKDINEDKNPNCVWKWKTLRLSHESLESAKQFVRTAQKNIEDQLNIYKG